MAKLVLDIEPEIIKQAEDYANETHKDLSVLVSDFLKGIGNNAHQNDPLAEAIKNMVVPEDIKAVTGILKGTFPEDMKLWEMKYELLKEKHDL